jgi:predicted AlkP superfamily phosphohydrolase/phosphomutase
MTIRTLFIGMDGSTFTVLDSLTAGDNPVMPFMKKLFENGVRSKLRSTPNPLTPPAWVSLMTGRSPGNHGLYDFLKSSEVNGELYTELYSATDCQVETIWSIASRQGRKVAALNLPFTAPPPRDLNGIILPGFIPWKHLKRNTQPKDFYNKLKEDLPSFDPKELAWDFEKEEKAIQHLTDQERKDWVAYHLPREEQWFNVAKYVLTNEQPDLMAVMFDGTDKLQHQVWRFVDPELQNDECSDYHKAMRELSLAYFAQLDGHVKDLVEAAGENTQVFLASDHGFTAQKEVLFINAFLKEKGYLQYKETPDEKSSSFFATIDLAKTTAYCRTPSSNGITIRVKNGWNDTGINAEDYEAFRAKLISELEALVDPETGERIVTAVRTREEVFAGIAMETAPDLTLTLRDHGFVSIKDSYPVVQKLDEVIGTHHPDGVFIAYGAGIKKGEQIPLRNIVDVAATLLYSLGLPVPEDFEGVVPQELFTENHLEQNPVVIGAKTNPPSHGSTDEMSGDEKDALMRQLAALGYAE